MTFDDPAGAAAGLDAVRTGYTRHATAARRLAETTFDAQAVLPALLAGQDWPMAPG